MVKVQQTNLTQGNYTQKKTKQILSKRYNCPELRIAFDFNQHTNTPKKKNLKNSSIAELKWKNSRP